MLGKSSLDYGKDNRIHNKSLKVTCKNFNMVKMYSRLQQTMNYNNDRRFQKIVSILDFKFIFYFLDVTVKKC